MRIVSLVPSLTELLIHLELDVVGRTKFCIHPNQRLSKIPKVGGTKTVNYKKVIDQKPDLVVANKEENTKEDILALENAGLNVYLSNIHDFDSSLSAISDIGRLTNTESACNHITKKLNKKVCNFPQINKSVCYLIWQKPYMTIGNDTYIFDMLKRCGFFSVYSDRKRYPEVSLKDIKEKHPDVIMLSSEPFPFKQKHVHELQSFIPDTEVILVDGEFFSWYGTRLLELDSYTI